MAGVREYLRSSFVLITLRYAFDWILVVGFVIAAAFIGKIHGAHHPFNPYDPAFSYPYHDDTISNTVLVICSVLAPAIIIFVSCMLVPRSACPALSNNDSASKSLVWKHKFLNWNRGWLGLGLTCALSFFLSNCLKNVFGKPRPHMITVCQPDWTEVARIVKTTRTGPEGILAWNPIVTSDICTTTDITRLDEAFRSYPSGHATMSFAGMTYISLFLYSTLLLTLTTSSTGKLPYTTQDARKRSSSSTRNVNNRASKLLPPSLPLATFVVIIFFFCLAIWIGATRYLDFKHAGIDIFSGACLGFISALAGTWWYAMPAAGGVAKGRWRTEHRSEHRRSRTDEHEQGQEDFDEPRGPIGRGERINMDHDSEDAVTK